MKSKTKAQKATKIGKIAILLIAVILANLIRPFPFSNLQVAHAAALTALSDTMSSLKVDPATSSHVIRFTTPTGAEESTDTIIITFPSDFNFTSKTISTVTFTHGATTGAETTETLAASPTGSAWGAAFSGTENRVLTLTAPTDGVGAGALAATQKVIITYDSTNSINASAGSYSMAISGTFGDTGNIAVTTVTDDSVAITSTVAQSLSFSLSANSLNLGALSSSAAVTGSHTFAVATNATSGVVVTVAGATLTSGSNTITACTAAGGDTSAAGTEQFGINLKDNTAPNVGAEVSGTAPLAAAVGDYAVVDKFQLVTGETIASSAAGINTSTFTVSYLANISGATEYGTYTTTLTYTATATY